MSKAKEKQFIRSVAWHKEDYALILKAAKESRVPPSQFVRNAAIYVALRSMDSNQSPKAN